jgi:phosphate:Na+ symporter
MNSLSLAIGANLGTTVTAVLGSLTSNSNGKRLAVAHLIFNVLTALFAVVFIKVLINLVDFLSVYIGISENDIALKLSLFHTLFNAAGILLVTPFIGRLVTFLETLFVVSRERRSKPRYLDEEVVKSPGPALIALYKESAHLFDSTSQIIVQALRLHRHEVFSDSEIDEVIKTMKTEEIDVDVLYGRHIKYLYSDILRYAILSENHMDERQRVEVYKIKLACRDMVEAIKDIRELQKNIAYYMSKENESIKNEYNFLRRDLAEVLRVIADCRDNPGDVETVGELERMKEQNKGLDIVSAKRLSILLREEKIDERMASSLLNDGTYTNHIVSNLLTSAELLWGARASAENEDSDDFELQLPGHSPLIQ